MLVNGADFFLLRPGLVVLALGLLLTVPLAGGPVTVGSITFSLHWMLAGLALTIFGLQCFYCGCVAQVLYDYSGKATRRWLGLFRYTRSIVCSGIALVSGLALISPLLFEYRRAGFGHLAPQIIIHTTHQAVMGLVLVSIALINYIFTLLLHAAALYVKPKTLASQ